MSLHARVWFYDEIYQKEIGFDSVLINTATKCTFPLFAKLSKVGDEGYKLLECTLALLTVL